ncbi:MAG TPA: DUF58 domain-containing protein [Burkholderiaceae bacterium]
MTPSRRLLAAVLLLALAGAVLAWLPDLRDYWAGAALAFAAAAAFDALLTRRVPELRVERRIAGVWPVGVWNEVGLTLRNEGASRVKLELFDDYPTHWQLEGLPHASTIAPGTYVTVTYRLKPKRRGDAHFGAPYLRIMSPLGLWRRVRRIGPEQGVKVFPDFSQLLGHTLTATDRRAPAAGAIRKRRRGEGTDFRQLREYRQGDSMRSIDWKATARQQKPITREYQEERDQQVVFLLDTGRRMLAEDGAYTHFDHALNAVLTLGFLAQRQGDAVGLMSFGGETRWLSPYKGRTGLDRLLSGVYDLQPAEVAPDYTQAATALLARLKKRAFIVLITNLRDEDDRAMREACELLSTRHLVLCASMREKALDLALSAPAHNFAGALRASAAAHYLDQRDYAIKRLGIRASHLFDITPEQLSMTLVNRYRDIKESGQL